MKFKIATFFLFCFLFSNAQPKVSSGEIKLFENFKSEFVEARTVYVWVPDGYTDKKKYAVLYMHDGQMLFDPATTWNKQSWDADETAARFMYESKLQEFIIVGIASLPDYRMSDYFPQKPFEALPKKVRDSIYKLKRDKDQLLGAKINSDNYLKFITKELKPLIDQKYSTKPDRANTYIAGASMGGLISLYAICEYPEIFGGAACMSTHWTGVFGPAENPVPAAFLDYLKAKLPSPATHRIYFDLGTETLDADYAYFQEKADALMKQKGYSAANWKTKTFAGDDHSEKSWSARFKEPLAFLFTKPKVAAPVKKSPAKKAATKK